MEAELKTLAMPLEESIELKLLGKPHETRVAEFVYNAHSPPRGHAVGSRK